MRILDAVEEVARRQTLTPLKVALAWLIAQPSVTAPIASAATPAQLDELTIAETVKLDESSMALLDKASGYEETEIFE